jgi:hypothetical protein
MGASGVEAGFEMMLRRLRHKSLHPMRRAPSRFAIYLAAQALPDLLLEVSITENRGPDRARTLQTTYLYFTHGSNRARHSRTTRLRCGQVTLEYWQIAGLATLALYTEDH